VLGPVFEADLLLKSSVASPRPPSADVGSGAGPSGLAADAWRLMRRFVEANAADRELKDRLGLGAGSGRVKVLFLLRRRPMTLAELAEAHGVDRPYATPRPSDRRSTVVSLTRAGRDALSTP
jgi:DNA-binding MarR family transcriptional regulator